MPHTESEIAWLQNELATLNRNLAACHEIIGRIATRRRRILNRIDQIDQEQVESASLPTSSAPTT